MVGRKESTMTRPLPQSVTIRIRIAVGENIAIGQGKADLLEAIGRTGSISAAARELDMSYRKAWMLVDEMNQCFPSPVVTAAKGGLRGGGAQVTALGQEALTRFRRIQAKASAAIEAEVREFRKKLLD
jgi:molybdate transport system regulatory protein